MTTKSVLRVAVERKYAEINYLYKSGHAENLTSFAMGIMAGVQQTLAWLLEPGKFADPLHSIPGVATGDISCGYYLTPKGQAAIEECREGKAA